MSDGKVKIEIIAEDNDAAKKIKDTEESLGGLGKKSEETGKKTKQTKSRFKELTDTIMQQERDLEDLKSEYVQTAINLGETSKEAQDLKQKYSELNRELKENKGLLDSAQKGLEDMGDGAEEGGKGLGILDIAAGDLVSSGIKSLISGIGSAISSLASLAEETREYREDMAKLDTSFKTQGHSVEAGRKAYEDFYAILGESDRSVEAVNHLAELTNNTEDLSKWSTIAAGVTAKFGDSLPIEGLTEAANETAKVGQTTGVLADALNWVSKDSAVFKQALGGNQKALNAFNYALKTGENVEDAFTAALGKMSSEQERSAAITNTLNGIYADAAGEYNAMTAETQKARRAAAELEASQARLGAAFEPVSTLITTAKSALFNYGANIAENVTTRVSDFVNVTKNLTDEQKKLVESSNAAAAKANELKTAADEAALGITAQFNYTQSLADELFRLADANGVVQEADQARVEFILGQLKEATGEEYRMVDGVIQKYGELKSSINDVIAAKQAELILGAYQEAYTQALIAVEQKYNEMLERSMVAGKLKMELDEEMARHSALMAEFTAAAADGLSREEAVAWGNRIKESEGGVAKIRMAYDSEVEKLQEVEGEYETYSSQISTYAEAQTLILEGKSQEAIAALNRQGNGFVENAAKVDEATKSNIQALEDEVVKTGIALGILEAEYAEKQGNLTEAQDKEYKARIAAAKKEAQDARKEYKTVGGDMVEGLVEGVDEKDGNPVWNLAGKLAGIVKKGIEAARKAADAHSPARETIKLGKDIVDGLIVGEEDKRKEAVNAFSSATKEVIGGIEKEMEDGIKRIDKELERLDDVRTKANANAVDAQKKALNKEKKALQERQKAFSEFARNHEKQLSEMAKLEDDYAKNMVKVQETLTKDIETLWKNFESTRENRTQSIINSLGLFDEVEKKEAASGSAMTHNLRDQVAELERYNDAIFKLSQREVNPEFIESMLALGVDNLPELEAFNRMSDEELSKYAALWEEKNRLAGAAAAKSLEMAREETVREIAGLADAAKKEAEILTTEYRGAMVALVGEVKDGMLATSEAGVKALGEDLDEYLKAGKALMESVAEGIEEGKSSVINSAIDTIVEALEAAQIEAGLREEITATVNAENARYGYTPGVADNGMGELTRAVGAQTASINSLGAQSRAGSRSSTVVLELNGRELGRAVVETGTSETVRTGVSISGGAR